MPSDTVPIKARVPVLACHNHRPRGRAANAATDDHQMKEMGLYPYERQRPAP